jgi:hypothetical protein
MIDHILNFFYKLTFAAWCSLLLPFVFIAIAFIIRKTVKQPFIKWASLFILVLFFFRIVLFGNPFAWAVYNKLLPVQSIDWRHHDVIACEAGKYLRPENHIRYLAVGSSQTSVIYNKYARQNKDFSLFALAGLSPLDFYAYRNEICRRKPDYVLMNLSEFDMARNPELSSSKWSPFSFRDITELKSIIDTTDYFTPDERKLVYDLFFSKYLIEYKYSFVFKDLLEMPFNKNKAAVRAEPDRVNDSLALAVHLKYLSELSDKYIPFNMYYLAKGIQYLNSMNIPVIIVEGQYNPLAYQPHNMALNIQVHALLNGFVSAHPMNSFLSRDLIPPFVLEDYRDGYHVKEEAGFRYAGLLIKELNSGKFKIERK